LSSLRELWTNRVSNRNVGGIAEVGKELIMFQTLKPPAFTTQSELVKSFFYDLTRLVPSFIGLKGSMLGVIEDLNRDRDYIEQRLADEGPAFLFTVLPKLGKAVEKALIREEPLQVPMGFCLYPGSRLPRFMYTLFKSVFEEDGTPLPYEKVNPYFGYLIRQLCLMFSKVEGVVSKTQVKEAVDAFLLRVRRESGYNQDVPNG